MKRMLKAVAECLAMILVLPTWVTFLVQRCVLGHNAACQRASQRASSWPGLGGQYLRRVLMRRVLRHVGRDVVISFGTLLSKPTAELADGVYLGAYCLLGDVRVGENTLIADQVCIPSGSRQHGTDRLDVPIRDQEGRFDTVTIGRDCWIGSGAIVLADVGDHAVVAAGSVVTRSVDDYAVVAGNPAKPIGDRRGETAE